MLVLWLGGEFYREMYVNFGENGTIDPRPWRLGDEMWDLKSTGIFLISLSGPRSGFIQMIPCDVMACRGDYKRTVIGSQRWTLSVLIDWHRLWSGNVFGISLLNFIRCAS
ncbi:hypothetical protein AVEN_193849-1 [Araneus ventricosus]|uniref:Uncharacterized protein n=1 Tax=Araneus ventricosus TaxID=182803 RepID=A0A4Y2I0U7_ARAVE|nr:hypothetical protein AVEN_193849-1 [Araneus ventricosus]